jgi:hypothetical protein
LQPVENSNTNISTAQPRKMRKTTGCQTSNLKVTGSIPVGCTITLKLLKRLYFKKSTFETAR